MINYSQKELGLAYIETDSGSGSGFLITSHGLLLTCAHVVAEAKFIYVRLTDNRGTNDVYPGKVLFEDKELDYAVVQLEELQAPTYYYELETDYSNVKTGDDIAVFGFPYGSNLNHNVMELEPTLTKGYIASRNKFQNQKCFYIDVDSAPGNSGGPVFSLKSGKVIGRLEGSFGADRAPINCCLDLLAFFKNNVRDE